MQDNAKIIELEKRIARLESNAKRGFNHYRAKKERIYASKKHNADFRFKATADECLLFSLTIKTFSPNYAATIELDGTKAMTVACEKNASIDFLLPLTYGEKKLSVKLSASASFMCEMVLETTGAIEYVDKECLVTAINEAERSTICYCYDDDLLVKEYNGQMRTVIQKEDVKSATICKLGDNFALFYIDKDSILQCEYFTGDEFETIRSSPIDRDVTSVCAFSGSDTVIAFSVKGGRVYRYTLDENFNQTTQKTAYGAKRVACDPSLSGYIVITDFSDNGKIIKI